MEQGPLQGSDLIDCARANAPQGIHTAAKQCGYNDNLEQFEIALKQACDTMGIRFQKFTDLIDAVPERTLDLGTVVTPDSPD